MAIDLGKQIGPLPLGAWVAVVGTGVGIVVWSRNSAPPADPAEGTLADLEDDLENVGRGPGWVAVPPPGEPPPAQPPPTDNEEWARQAISKLIALGYDPAMANQAITKALGGSDRLSVREWALWTQALAVMGPPPYPVQVRPPNQQPNNPPNNPPPGNQWGVRYWVKRGDTLKKIAVKFYRDESKWERIFQANRKVLNNNPNTKLRVGLVLFIPRPTVGLPPGTHPPAGPGPRDPDPQARQYITKPGDTLMGVSFKVYKDATKWERIYEANKRKIRERKPRARLRVGMRLVIPKLNNR